MPANAQTTIFWDVGGVLLTNGWDTAARARAAQTFNLDIHELEDRHARVVADFETGGLTLDRYLECTVFHRPRKYAREAVAAFMYAQSEPMSDHLHLVRALARTGRYRLAMLNNESLELNDHRIATFALRDIFTVFVSSCHVGLRKPDPAIYRMALQVTQSAPEASLFIDDRALNLECASALGMRTIHYRAPEPLRDALTRAGLELPETPA